MDSSGSLQLQSQRWGQKDPEGGGESTTTFALFFHSVSFRFSFNRLFVIAFFSFVRPSVLSVFLSFSQPEGVLTEVEERVVELNPSKHPGTCALKKTGSELLQASIEALFSNSWPADGFHEEWYPRPKGPELSCVHVHQSKR